MTKMAKCHDLKLWRIRQYCYSCGLLNIPDSLQCLSPTLQNLGASTSDDVIDPEPSLDSNSPLRRSLVETANIDIAQ